MDECRRRTLIGCPAVMAAVDQLGICTRDQLCGAVVRAEFGEANPDRAGVPRTGKCSSDLTEAPARIQQGHAGHRTQHPSPPRRMLRSKQRAAAY
jgi:hypothetical protein